MAIASAQQQPKHLSNLALLQGIVIGQHKEITRELPLSKLAGLNVSPRRWFHRKA
jgi:hypothetical protein